MSVEGVVTDAASRYELAPKRYVGALLVVARSARKAEYVLVQIGSGTFFRTDRLGALVARALIGGRSDEEAIDLAHRLEAGAGSRARQLIDLLDEWSALTVVPPTALHGDRGMRRVIARALGVVLSALGLLSRHAPSSVLASAFRVLPSTPMASHVWRCSQQRILLSLRRSGYADRPQSWIFDVGRRCAIEPVLTYLFNYLSLATPPKRLERLVERLFDRGSAGTVAGHLEAAGPTVAAFLHGPLCAAVPNAIRARGQDVVRVVAPRTHGIKVSGRSGRLGAFFGETQEMAVDETDPNASGALLRHLKAGRSVYVALDKEAGEGKTATIEVLGRCFIRNDAPSWLAVRSGRPLALWTTYNSSTGVRITASPELHPDPSLPVGLRVAELSQRLYSHAEAAIRAHPEAWACWHYMSLLEANPP